jgi:hypothetical protein
MRYEITKHVDIDIDDIMGSMDRKEKTALYNELADELADELGDANCDEDFDVAKYLGKMSAFEQKKILCNALGVSSYYDEQGLRKALEKIIKAS